MDDEASDQDDDFDYEQFLLAEQVRKYSYDGLYPQGIFVIWTLLRAGCYDLSGCDDLGTPPIVHASKCGSIALLRLLLYYKADINAVTKLRETALIVACRNKRMRVVKLLLKRGAQTDPVDRTGYSALRWAVTHECTNMVKLLLRYDASVTKDSYTSGSALDIARHGSSEQHAIILVELEKKLVLEREAFLIEIIKQKKQDVIAEIDEYREKRQAQKEAKKAAAVETKTASKVESAPLTTPKSIKRSRRRKTQKVVAGTRQHSNLSVGTRVPTPPIEQGAWKSLENTDDSEWIKVATGKWQTRKHLHETRTPVPTTETTMVEAFAPDKETVDKLLSNDGKWQIYLGQQMPHRVSQVHLAIEDL